MSLMRVWPSGRLIDPMDPVADDIDIFDVAHHLAGIFRYGGASRLTVAQHCCEMALMALDPASFVNGRVGEAQRSFAYECLMHDCAEYLLGDMIRPLKHHSALGPLFCAAEDRVIGVMRAALHITNRHSDRVKALDNRMCATEQRDLFGENPADAFPGVTVHPWSPDYAERKFTRLFFLLKPESLDLSLTGNKEAA